MRKFFRVQNVCQQPDICFFAGEPQQACAAAAGFSPEPIAGQYQDRGPWAPLLPKGWRSSVKSVVARRHPDQVAHLGGRHRHQQFVADITGVGHQQRACGQSRQQMDQMASVLLAVPLPRQPRSTASRNGRWTMAVSYSVGLRIFFAGLSPCVAPIRQKGRTFHARAIAAEGMKASIEQAVAEERENAATHARSQALAGQVPARRSRL